MFWWCFFSLLAVRQSVRKKKSVCVYREHVCFGRCLLYKVKPDLWCTYMKGGQYDWLKCPLWHAMLKLNQPSSVPVLLSCFISSLCCFSSAHACACSNVIKSTKAVSLQMAKCVTYGILFQSRDQDGDPSKHPWAKPGSVSTFWCLRERENIITCCSVCTWIFFSAFWLLFDCLCVYRGNTPFGIDSMPDLRKRRPIPLVSELVSTHRSLSASWSTSDLHWTLAFFKTKQTRN